MPRDPQILIFLGIKNEVVALDDRTGTEVWRVKLRSGDFVSVLWDGEALFASNSGEVWRIHPERGEVMWHNQLKGMGRGLISMASTRRANTSGNVDLVAEKRRRDAAASAGAVASTA